MQLPQRWHPLGLVAGFAIWALAFSTLYGTHGAACAAGLAPSTVRLSLLLLLLLFLGLHLGLVLWLLRSGRGGAFRQGYPFLHRLSLVLAIAAAPTTLWTTGGVLLLSVC